MFDVWIGDMNIALFIWIFILIVVLPLQLVLCFKVKTKFMRLLPVIVLSVLTIASAVAATVGTDWDVLFYLICTVYFAIMLFVCGFGWGIWAIIKKARK